MKTTISRVARFGTFAAAFAVLLFGERFGFAATNYILLPAASANQDSGGGADDFRSVMRIQECYGGSLFPQQPITIRELRFRPSAAVGFAFSTTISNIQINLATTSSQPEALNANFASNLGPDKTTVFNGALPMSSGFTGPAAGPKDFDMVVPLTTPFTFDPSKGNLVIDIINRSGSTASYIDSWGARGDQTGRAWAYGVNPTNAAYIDWGVEDVEIFYDPALGQTPVLTGISLYNATASGAGAGSAHWNTLGAPDLTYNLYLFTGSTASPTFLNSGNTDASLNPNLVLESGSHVIQFAGQNLVSGYMGINFYFNNSTSNAITAVVPWDGSTGFSVVGPGVSTVGESGNQPGSGQLSFSVGNLVVTLTDFHKTGGYTDIIAGYNNAPDTAQDTTGTFTLSVTPPQTPPVLTGVSLYNATASGAGAGSAHWNTLGAPDLTYNLYLFTGSTASPTFLNSGNTDASLNPDLALDSGSHVIQFAAQNVVSGYMGINFYFNNSTSNAITAVVPWDGSTGFSAVGPGVSTVGQSGNQPGSGQLSFSFGNQVVTLTDFHKTDGYTDIIAGYNNVPDTAQDTTGTFTLSVGPATVEGTPPAITTPPQSQTVTAGSDATFSVSASGTAPLSYHWRFNGQPIAGATSSTLTLHAVEPTNAGTYSVQVSNSVGSVVSAGAQLTVLTPTDPILTGVSLYNATASGTGLGSEHWNTLGTPDLTYNVYLFTGSTASPTFLNSGNTDASLNPNLVLGSGAHVIQFAGQNPISGYMGINFYFNNSTSNRITAVVPWDGSTGFSAVAPGISTVGQFGNQPSSGQLSFSFGNQVVTLTDFHKTAGYTDIIAGYNNAPDTAQDATGTFTLSVGPPAEATAPTITTQPQGRTAYAGESVTFSVVASGTSPLTYQWRFNGTDIPGASGASITLNNVKFADAGSYSVRVSNAAGAVTSSDAVLVVKRPPDFDLSRDFSTNSNPHGVWTFGWKGTLSGPLTPWGIFVQQRDSAGVLESVWTRILGTPSQVYHNGTTNTSIVEGGQGVYPPGTTWFYPGYEGNPDNYGVIRFTAPASGSYEVDALVHSYLDGPLSGDTDFHVLHNDTELFTQLVPGSSGTGYSNVLALASGDTLDFVVGRGADNHLYGSGLKIKAGITLLNRTPVAKATVLPLFDALPGLSNLLVLSANGSDANVVLDGSLSTDPENNPLEYFWLDASANPFAAGVRATNVFAVGDHKVTLAVSDGTTIGTAVVEFDVISLSEATAAIYNEVLGSNELRQKSKAPLLADLKTAMNSFERANSGTQGNQLTSVTSAVNHLSEFQKKVAQTPINSPGLADAWIRAAQQITEALGR